MTILPKNKTAKKANEPQLTIRRIHVLAQNHWATNWAVGSALNIDRLNSNRFHILIDAVFHLQWYSIYVLSEAVFIQSHDDAFVRWSNHHVLVKRIVKVIVWSNPPSFEWFNTVADSIGYVLQFCQIRGRFFHWATMFQQLMYRRGRTKKEIWPCQIIFTISYCQYAKKRISGDGVEIGKHSDCLKTQFIEAQ